MDRDDFRGYVALVLLIATVTSDSFGMLWLLGFFDDPGAAQEKGTLLMLFDGFVFLTLIVSVIAPLLFLWLGIPYLGRHARAIFATYQLNNQGSVESHLQTALLFTAVCFGGPIVLGLVMVLIGRGSTLAECLHGWFETGSTFTDFLAFVICVPGLLWFVSFFALFTTIPFLLFLWLAGAVGSAAVERSREIDEQWEKLTPAQRAKALRDQVFMDRQTEWHAERREREM
jgi:hypothetical protein